jgi:hypothetical protein
VTRDRGDVESVLSAILGWLAANSERVADKE